MRGYPDDYIEGPPELVVEIVGSSRAYDLHQKKSVYRRNGIREYLVWITGEQRLIWLELRDDEYQEIAPTPEGLLARPELPRAVARGVSLAARRYEGGAGGIATRSGKR